MILLVIGVLLFAGVHLTKSLAPSFRTEMQQRLGRMATRAFSRC